MQKQHAFHDTNKTMILSHKDHGGVRIRIVAHNHPNSEIIDFHLTEEEKRQLQTAVFDTWTYK